MSERDDPQQPATPPSRRRRRDLTPRDHRRRRRQLAREARRTGSRRGGPAHGEDSHRPSDAPADAPKDAPKDAPSAGDARAVEAAEPQPTDHFEALDLLDPVDRRPDPERGDEQAAEPDPGEPDVPSGPVPVRDDRPPDRHARRAGAPHPPPSRHARRRRARLRVAAIVVLLGLVAIAVVVVAFGGIDRAMDLVVPTDSGTPAAVSETNPQPSITLVTADERDPSGRAQHLMVLAFDRDRQQGTVLLVPAGTVADVPGYGSFQLGEAYAFGQGPLVSVTLDNLMDIRTDGVATLSEAGWATLLTRVGGFEVDVRSRLVDGDEVRFEAGPQFLDGPRLAEYLTFRADDETELETLPRVQQVVRGMLDAIAQDPDLLTAIFADGAPMIDTANAGLAHQVLSGLASAQATDGGVTTLTLPVSALGSGREDAYRVDGARLEELVDRRFAASQPTDGAGVGRRVQILNGNGSPGIGQRVAEELLAGGYRVVLTGNADRFSYSSTRIVLYGGDEEHLALARDIQDRLGVGRIEQAGTPQSVVDVTIVVGADFPPD